MRVAIAEDNIFYRTGLVQLLEVADATVLHACASGQELLTYLAEGDLPDVALLDNRMGGREDEGLETALVIRRTYPDVGVLLLSAYREPSYAERLFADGAAGKGYLLKDNLNNVAELKEALNRVHRGQTYSDATIVDDLIARQRTSRLHDRLTAREVQILTHLARGLSNGAIATAAHTTTGAIEAAVSTIYSKLDISDAPDYNRRVLAVIRWLDNTG